MQSFRFRPTPSGPNHWDDVVDTPRPAFELHADRADLDLQTVVLEDHAVIVACLGMDDFAKE